MVRIESIDFASWRLSQVCLNLTECLWQRIGWWREAKRRPKYGFQTPRLVKRSTLTFKVVKVVVAGSAKGDSCLTQSSQKSFFLSIFCSNWEIHNLRSQVSGLGEIHVFGTGNICWCQWFWSLWHQFESFTIVGTRISASKAGFVHGDSLLWICGSSAMIR